ncbi:MAG: SDR family oxidoreductase [Bacteroidetes bacterium]|nr:MAG: SDR family oxidoreductase [Bacteroidota bacterium]
MRIDLSGKRVLVTGGSRGIGSALCRAFSEAGARVAVHYGRSREAAENLASDIGGGAMTFGAPLDEIAATEKLFDDVLEAFGGLDVLVNNAGVAVESPISKDVLAYAADWDYTMAVNLRASGLLSRRAIQAFRQNDPTGGRMIHIASRAAFRGDTEDLVAYAASKGGIVSMSRTIARAYGREKIVSFVIAPGWVRTDMAEEGIELYGEEFLTKDNALEGMALPEDVAPMVLLLASGLADHATGTSIDINSGSYVR